MTRIVAQPLDYENPDPLLNLALELARLRLAPKPEPCGHELTEPLEKARNTCHGCFVHDALELAAREVSK